MGSSRACCPPYRCRGDMALTGRAALLALLAIIPVALSPDGWTILGLLAALIVASVVDAALAPSVRVIEVTRAGDTACRLGTSAEVRLILTNRTRRRLRGVLRDAWAPSAGASPRT